MGSCDNKIAEVVLTFPDNARMFDMLPPLSEGHKPTLSTDRQVLPSSDGRDIGRNLRSLRLRENCAHGVQSAHVSGHVARREGPSKEDAADSCIKSHSQSTEMSETSQPRSLDVIGTIKEFQLTQIRLRELAMTQQASSIDAVEVLVFDNDEEDDDSPSDEEEHVPEQPAKFEFITRPATSRPSNSFRRIMVRPVPRYNTNASVIVPPDVQESPNNEYGPDGLLKCAVRNDTATSLEWPKDIGDMDSI